MSRRAAGSMLLTLGVAMASVVAHGQGSAPRPGPSSPSLVTTHPTIQAAIDRVSRRSALWRDAAETTRALGRRVVILTPDQVVVPDEAGRLRPFDRTVPAEVSPVVRDGFLVDVVMVVVNLPLIESVHDRHGTLPAEFEADLDRILVHEVYGHAVPYLLAGNLSGRCADPRPGQRAIDACAIRRENAVRAELGLGRRVDAGLQGLTLARRDWR
jgi:hypothetical protein